MIEKTSLDSQNTRARLPTYVQRTQELKSKLILSGLTDVEEVRQPKISCHLPYHRVGIKVIAGNIVVELRGTKGTVGKPCKYLQDRWVGD